MSKDSSIPEASTDKRAAFVEGWIQAQSATSALGRDKKLPDLDRARVLIDQGAIVPMIGAWIYREALQDDNLPLFKLLLRGSEHITTSSRLQLVGMAANYGADQCLELMIQEKFPLDARQSASHPQRMVLSTLSGPHQFIAGLEHESAMAPLETALENNYLGCARQLLEAGVTTEAERHPQAPKSDRTYMRCASSAEAADLLVEFGVTPKREDLKRCLGISSNKRPIPDLLAKFIDMGLDLRAGSQPGSDWHVWSVLTRDDESLVQHFDLMVQCGRVLLEAGHSPAVELRKQEGPAMGRFKPYALRVMLHAGMTAQEVIEQALPGWRPSGNTAEAKRQCEDAGELLRELARAGGEIDVFWNEGAAATWRNAMVKAGVDPGESALGIPEELRAEGQQARLADRTAKASPQPSSRAMRL